MDWFGDHLTETWLLVALALASLEVLSTDLIFIMLACGALVAMVIAMLGGPFLLQLIIGVLVAFALMALIRPPLIRRLHAGPTLKTGAEALVGARAVVLEEVADTASGRVKIGGDVWTAKSYDEDDRIEPGTKVEVVAIKGATAYVLRSQQPEPPAGS
jgi:membrane protein implicated in regulation of membrane protease activity